jgi:hypothetical protein
LTQSRAPSVPRPRLFPHRGFLARIPLRSHFRSNSERIPHRRSSFRRRVSNQRRRHWPVPDIRWAAVIRDLSEVSSANRISVRPTAIFSRPKARFRRSLSFGRMGLGKLIFSCPCGMTNGAFLLAQSSRKSIFRIVLSAVCRVLKKIDIIEKQVGLFGRCDNHRVGD